MGSLEAKEQEKKQNERSCAIWFSGSRARVFSGAGVTVRRGNMSTDVSGRGRELITHRPRCALVTLHGGMDGSCMGGPSSTLQRCDWKYNWAYANPPQTNGWTDGALSHTSLVWLGLA